MYSRLFTPVSPSVARPSFRVSTPAFALYPALLCTLLVLPHCRSYRSGPDAVSHATRSEMASQLTAFAKTAPLTSPLADVQITIVPLGKNREPVYGATVVLESEDHQLNYGRLSDADGRCRFSVPNGSYTLRVQFTGLKTFMQRNFAFRAGHSYELEVGMAVPAALSRKDDERTSRTTAQRDGM